MPLQPYCSLLALTGKPHGFVWFRGQAVSAPAYVSAVSALASQRLYKSLELLDLLFSKSLTARERLDIMEKKFNITLTEELEGYCEYCYS